MYGRKSAALVFTVFLSTLSFADISVHPVFAVSKQSDVPLVAAGAAVLVSGIVANRQMPYHHWDNDSKRDKSSINAIDRPFARGYVHSIDTVSTAVMWVIAVSPVSLSFLPEADWKAVCLMYGEAILFSQGIKEGLKSVVRRYRPYCYFNSPPDNYSTPGDYIKSWPSGHTATAFTAAVFTSYVYCQYCPESPYKALVTAGCISSAACVGALRMMSGCHFLTDVLGGAFVGSACGFLIPFVHKVNKETAGAQFSVQPSGFSVKIAL